MFTILLISGCTANDQTVNENYMYFLFATPLKEHTIWLQAKEGFDQACADYDLKCDWMGPGTIDTDQMNQTIETGISQKADAIITQGVVDADLLDEAYRRNIPVMLVDSNMPEVNVFGYIGKDFTLQAQLLLDDIEAKYGEDEYLKIAIQVAEIDFNIAKDQIKDIEAVFDQHPGGFEIASISESKSDSVRAKKAWEQVLNENSDINIAINFAGESAAPCSEMAQHLDLRNNILIYGVDSMSDTIEGIKNESIDGTIVVSFFDYGYVSVKMMYEAIINQEPFNNEQISAKLMMVTKENVNHYNEELRKQ